MLVVVYEWYDAKERKRITNLENDEVAIISSCKHSLDYFVY